MTKGENGKTDYEYIYEQDIYKTDHRMRKISLVTALGGNTNMRQKFIKNINSMISIAEKINIIENSPVTFYNAVEDTGEASKQSEYMDSEMDWFLTINRYRIKMKGTIVKFENNYQLEVRYGLVDYYDWKTIKENYDSYREILNEIDGFLLDEISAYLELFHKAGLSRNYTNYGEIPCTITWNYGERLGSGANIS